MKRALSRSTAIALMVALAAVALGWLAWDVLHGRRLAGYRAALRDKGFPADYTERLAELQDDHPAWVFVPLPVTDLSWCAIVDKECSPGWNLVVYAQWAPEEWKALKEKNYTPYYAKDAKAYDSGAWYQASREAIAYFMDPRNFLNEREVFMFETLEHDAASQTQDAVERALATTFMSKATYDGGARTFSDLLMEVGRKVGVSPVFLAGRLASEQGSGSAQAFGTIGDALASCCTNASDRVGNAVIWGRRFTRGGASTAKVMERGKDAYNGYYNFFNFRACGLGVFEIKYNAWAEATCEETRQKYLGPWDTQAKAIEGGAIKIKERYVDTCRHTRYLQKFSVLRQAGDFRWKQYMQNIAAPLAEARNTSRAYDAVGTLEAPYRFLIPVYRDMPRSPSPDPARGRSAYSPSR